MKQDIDAAISNEIRLKSKKQNGEWLLSFDDALNVIESARAAAIAILGVEVFQTVSDGIKVLNYSGYGHEDRKIDWGSFVELNYRDALQFVHENKLGEGHVYILTSTSKNEFEALKAKS